MGRKKSEQIAKDKFDNDLLEILSKHESRIRMANKRFTEDAFNCALKHVKTIEKIQEDIKNPSS